MIALNRSRQIILVSVFSVTVMVAIGAMDHLISLDASILKPLNIPSLETGKTEPDLTLDLTKSQVAINPTLNSIIAAKQTDRERQNVALAKLQEEQWLIQQQRIKNVSKKKTLAKTVATSPVVKPIVTLKSRLKISSIDVAKVNSTDPSPSMQIPQPDIQLVSEPIGDTIATIQPDLDAWSQSPAQMTPQTVLNSGDE